MGSHWYKDAVIYELDVRSFYDSNGDGAGDVSGLVDKLYYLQELGTTAVVLGPPQPVSLEEDEHDQARNHSVEIPGGCGSVQDLERFIREAHARRVRVILELFVSPLSDRAFGVEPHRTCQSGLKVMRHWLDAGVDGVKLEGLSNLTLCQRAVGGKPFDVHTLVKEMRAMIDGHYADRVFIAEPDRSADDVVAYFGDGDECHMAFNAALMPRLLMALNQEDRRPLVQMLRHTTDIPASCQWALVLRHHDELSLESCTAPERERMYRAYAPDPQMRLNGGIRRRVAPLLENDCRRIQLAYALMCSLPGSPVIYYGDEIGMGDNVHLDGCNGLRTPMQWSGDRNAGFSHADPARLSIPVNAGPVYGYPRVNVETQKRQPFSMFKWMRRLIAVRRQHPVFGRGTIEFLEPRNQTVFVHVRRHGDEQVLVVANLSGRAQSAELSLSFYAGVQPVELLDGTRFRRIGAGPYSLTLGPYGVFWLLLSRRAVRPTPASDIEAGLLATRPQAREAPAAAASVSRERRDWQQER